MNWHQARQGVLAENIANADTPGYQARDLPAPDLKAMADGAPRRSLAAARTHRMHFSKPVIAQRAHPASQKATAFEITPDANNVVLEEQTMKATTNQLDYQMATTLYSRSVGLLRTALGRGR